MTDSGAFSNPRDAAVMEAILKEMGVEDYEPNVIHQMLEFSYRYVTNVLEDARVYSEHAQKKELDISDVKLAVQSRLDHSFTSPPPREFLIEVARKKNSLALPLIPEKFGPRLPPERYCLTANNYKIIERKKTSTTSKPQVTTFRIPGKQITTTSSSTSSAAAPILRSQLSSPLLPPSNLSLTSSSASTPTQPTARLLTHSTSQGISPSGRQSMPTFSSAGQGGGNSNSNNNGVDSILGKRKL